jgi:hypothetical protein
VYIYTVTISYGGSNAFVLFLWDKITRSSGKWPITFTSDAASVATLRTAGTNAGFTFSNISRVPVPPAPEVVP